MSAEDLLPKQGGESETGPARGPEQDPEHNLVLGQRRHTVVERTVLPR